MHMLNACVVAAAVVATVLLNWKGEALLLFNSEGYRPPRGAAWTILALAVALYAVVFQVDRTFARIKADHERYIAAQRAHNTPPSGLRPVNESAKTATVENYLSRGFSFDSALSEASGAPEVWKGDTTIQDSTGFYRQRGAIIYDDGSAVQFSVALLYRDDVWALADETRIRRQNMGRKILVSTAINRPLIRELIGSNDYILGIGLASSTPTSKEEQNVLLADARAYNIGYAVLSTKLKEPGRIFALSLGVAQRAPTIPEFEPRQRSVALIGVNASRDVDVSHVLDATIRLVALEGVDLRSYSRGQGGRLWMSAPWDAGFRSVAEMGTRGSTPIAGAWVLPGVPKGTK